MLLVKLNPVNSERKYPIKQEVWAILVVEMIGAMMIGEAAIMMTGEATVVMVVPLSMVMSITKLITITKVTTPQITMMVGQKMLLLL